MSYKPSIVALDYETALTDGTPSVEYYRPDFRVTSAAIAWRGADGTVKTRYYEGEDDVRQVLERLHIEDLCLVVHNFQFEYGVTKYRFPGLEGRIVADTMRLTQVADNGGKVAQRDFQRTIEEQAEEDPATPATTGLRLVDCTSRWLPPELRNHKDPAYTWLREHGVKPGQEGKNLHKLPPEIMEAYNVADAIVTLELYDVLTTEFKRIEYDWTLDHSLYMASARRIAEAKGRGVKIDREALQAYRQTILEQIAVIEITFRNQFEAAIREIERESEEAFVNALKSERGKAGRRKQIEDGEAPTGFNVGSNQQLARLFVDKLGITPKFWTEESKQSRSKRKDDPSRPAFEPSPSFKSAHLGTYGAGGEILGERRKRMLVLKQVESLLELSAADGRWHVDLRAAGTVTGRFAGGGAR